MTYLALAGEKITPFIRRGGTGCWLVKDRRAAGRLRRTIGSSVNQLNKRDGGARLVTYKSYQAIRDDTVYQVVTATIE